MWPKRATSAFSVVDLEFAIGDEILVVTTESAPFVSLTQ